jgi:hypothetical protein
MTYHEGLMESAEKVMAVEPQWLQLAHEAAQKLRSGFYDQRYVGIFFQKWRDSIDIYDGFFFLQISSAIVEGDLLYGSWDIGETPSPDREIKINREKLAILNKRSIIRATFDPLRGRVGSDGDGVVSWERPIELDRVLEDQRIVHCFARGAVPLEVGYTRITTTYHHLVLSGGVVRWPYGDTRIYVMNLVNPLYFRPDF